MRIGSICVARLRAILVVSVVVLFTGCFRAVLLDSESLPDHSTEDIVVSTNDGKRYRFDGGEYAIITNIKGEQVIRGEGKVYRGDGPEFEDFRGEILFGDVKRATTSETTPILYLSLALVVLMTWFAISFARGGGFGG